MIANKLYLKTSIDLYANGKLQIGKSRFVEISKDFIYISRDKNRSYWVLSKLSKPPTITFNDNKMTLRIASNKIVFKKPKEYKTAIMLLKKYL